MCSFQNYGIQGHVIWILNSVNNKNLQHKQFQSKDYATHFATYLKTLTILKRGDSLVGALAESSLLDFSAEFLSPITTEAINCLLVVFSHSLSIILQGFMEYNCGPN